MPETPQLKTVRLRKNYVTICKITMLNGTVCQGVRFQSVRLIAIQDFARETS